MGRFATGMLLVGALTLGACGDDGDGDERADRSSETSETSETSDRPTPPSGSERESAEPVLGEEFSVESTGLSGEVVILAEDAQVTSGGGVQLLEVYVTASTQPGSGGTLDIFLACGANFNTGKYFEAKAPTPRFPIDQATEGLGLAADTTVEGWLDLTLPMTPDGKVVPTCDSGVQLVFSWGIFKDNGIIDLPDDLARQLTGA